MMRGSITETEAYLGVDDPASHAFRGRLHDGNRSIYGPPGTWYVYRAYGLHWCANVVTGPRGIGAAVLLRGAVITDGLEVARARRGEVPVRRLSDGPGKLAAAFGIDRRVDGVRVMDAPVWLESGPPPPGISVTPRIGISRAVDWPLRFLATGKQKAPCD